MIRLRSARSWLPICCPASCWCFEARSRYLHARARDGAARWIGGTGNRVNRAQSGAIRRNQAHSLVGSMPTPGVMKARAPSIEKMASCRLGA